ncbi:hypothetical protein A4A49_24000 [Nicotiana attenuata]|uniref:Uncharacterized protein n=1 Tax=Nicotiana attenuata TaxID=49451 RepID=A0A314L2R0_NICAT|nr:hypothetical protein A4A49_24000 [Nicotiana attenuata]
MLTMQVEAVAFYCICRILCVSGSISWAIDTRRTRKIWSFSLDRSCRCSAMCACFNQRADLLDITFRILKMYDGRGT